MIIDGHVHIAAEPEEGAFRAPHLSGIAELKRAVTLYLGHLPAVLEEPRALPAVPTGGANRLDLDVHEVPETARLFRILDAWQSNGSVATLMPLYQSGAV